MVGELRFPRAAWHDQKNKSKKRRGNCDMDKYKGGPCEDTGRRQLSRSGQGSRLVQALGSTCPTHSQPPAPGWSSESSPRVSLLQALAPTLPLIRHLSRTDTLEKLASGRWLKTRLGWVWVGCSPFGKKSKDQLPCIQKPLGVLVLDTSPVG